MKKVSEKILRLHKRWVRLKKSCSRNGKKEVAQRSTFIEDITSEFEVKKGENSPEQGEKRKLLSPTNYEELPSKRVSLHQFDSLLLNFNCNFCECVDL